MAEDKDNHPAPEATEFVVDVNEQPTPRGVASQKVTTRMIFFSAFIALVAWVFTFDLGFSGTVLQMQPYNKSFGHCRPTIDATTGVAKIVCEQTALQQSLISLTTLFVGLGGATSGLVGHHLGRRGTIQFGALLTAIGAGGMMGSVGNFTAYLACKCISGVGLGNMIAAAPIYGTECTVAAKRGMLLALWNVGLGFGNAVAGAVCWGSSSYTHSNLAWQIPIICQIPLALVLGVGVRFFPESPRWLLTKGRDSAAKESFAWFYAKEANHPDVLLQVQDVEYHMEMEKIQGSTSNFAEIYRGINLRRTFVSGLIMVGLAITGSQFIGPYGAIFLARVGIKNPFLINMISACCTLAGTAPGPLVVEYGGRRLAMLCGYSSMSVCMLIIAIVGSALGQNNDTAKICLLVFLLLWAYLFGLFIGTSVWISAPEQHNLRLRTYGQASTTAVYQIFGFAASFYTPYMLNKDYGNMGTSVGYFYFAVTVIILMLTWAFVPETARLTLEQVDEYYFSGRRAWKTSIGRNKRIAMGEELDDLEVLEVTTEKVAEE